MTFSEITDQRPLTGSAKAVTDDTPERNTQQHAAAIAAEYFLERLGFSPWRLKNDEPKECDYVGFSGISEPVSRLH